MMRKWLFGAAMAAALAFGTARAEAKPGVDFITDARALYRVAACGDETGAIPDVVGHGDAKTADKVQSIVAGHCKAIHSYMDKFKDTYFDKGRAWFDSVVPKTAPKTVVYPFGGGDLISALVAFPDATEITTISLELAGDPRRIEKLTPDQISASLGALRSEIGGLVSVGSNTSTNLSASQKNELPGQVSSFLLGLVAGGYEPVSMRYFTLDDSGEIHYVEQADIDAADADTKAKHKSLKSDWSSPNFSAVFSNVEIEYRKVGDKDGPVRVHRHIGWNLGDKYLKDHPELLRHLEKKGKVTLLTKGASYLLWRDDFAQIRGYMLDHLAWMLSDSTGISPGYAKAANMEQETYGVYKGAFLEGARGGAQDKAFIALWSAQPWRKLPFRFGYVDAEGAAHLVVTRPRN
jgi:hypothetical protein